MTLRVLLCLTWEKLSIPIANLGETLATIAVKKYPASGEEGLRRKKFQISKKPKMHRYNLPLVGKPIVKK